MGKPANRVLVLIALFVLAMLSSACAPSIPLGAPTAASPVASPPSIAFTLTSSAFGEGATIPRKFTCDGENVSPQLKWSGAPPGTRSFALIMDDPDAPVGTFTHWVAFDVPTMQNEVAEGAKDIGKGGMNGRGQTGYTGPCPPFGMHRYFLTLYALDVESLGLNAGAARSDLEQALIPHLLAKTQLMGRYSR